MLLSSFLLFIYCFFQWIQINRNAMALFTASTRVRNCYRLLLLRFVFAQCALHRLRFTLDWDIYFLNLNLLEWTERPNAVSVVVHQTNEMIRSTYLLELELLNEKEKKRWKIRIRLSHFELMVFTRIQRTVRLFRVLSTKNSGLFGSVRRFPFFSIPSNGVECAWFGLFITLKSHNGALAF